MATGIPGAILPEGSKDAKAMMFLLTNQAPLAPYAAQTIKVEGTAHPAMKAVDRLKLRDGRSSRRSLCRHVHQP